MNNTEPTKPIDDELRNYDQYIIWQLVYLLRALKVTTSPLQNKMIESKAQLMAATIREGITADHKQLLDRVEKEVKKNADSGIEYEGNGWHTLITELAKLRKELGL